MKMEILELDFEQRFEKFFKEFKEMDKKPVFLFQGVKDKVRTMELDHNHTNITTEKLEDFFIEKSLEINFSFLHFDFSY